MEKELVVVIDFGGQYNQLVARRVRECNVYCEIYSYKTDLNKIKAMNPKGIILTGGWGLVSNILHDEIFADDAEWIRPNEETALWYYKSSLVCTGKETLVVSMPHPNRAAKNWTLELEKVLRATGRL
jgi:GMP synthase-like glutamine amidotransferase